MNLPDGSNFAQNRPKCYERTFPIAPIPVGYSLSGCLFACLFCYSLSLCVFVSAPASSDTKDKWEISRDKLEIGQRIGEGQFGMVFEGTLLSSKYFCC